MPAPSMCPYRPFTSVRMKTDPLRPSRRALRVALFLLAGAAVTLAGSIGGSARAAGSHPFFVQSQFRPHEAPHANPARAMREQRAQAAGAQRAQRAAQREQAQQQRGQDVREAQPQPPIQKQAEQSPAEGRPGRLTPDERRALRQQINDAGREIYRPRRP